MTPGHGMLLRTAEVSEVNSSMAQDGQQMIVDAIADECEAFYNRDFERWSGLWLHHEGTHRLGTLAGGHVDHKLGWGVHGKTVEKIMRQFPEPNLSTGAQVRRENMIVRISGDMAWASFDQYTPRTEDPLVNVGLSHQFRVLEKHDGQWKFVFAAHGDTQLEYYSFPCIRVDRKGTIEWMNEAARNSLKNHPILFAGSGFLRARDQAHNKVLHATIAEIADLSPIDVRRSVLADTGNRTAVPLVLEDGLDDKFQIIWVAWSDGMIVVSFDDEEAIAQRLELAQSLYRLSRTQVKLAGLVIEGMDLGQAAEKLGVSLNTVRTHLRRMYDKMKVHSQTALVRVILSTASPEKWS